MPIAAQQQHRSFFAKKNSKWGIPLHWAVMLNRKDLVKILLGQGADPLRNRPNHIQILHQTTIEIPGDWENAAEATLPTHLAAKFHQHELLEALVGAISDFESRVDLHVS